MFTPSSALAGGALIGASASAALLLSGRVAGISGIVAGLIKPEDTHWRAQFLAGLLAGGVILFVAYPSALRVPAVPLGLLAIAGLLVGVGTRIGGGCTSGHGVCGISRFSVRSIVATCTFMMTGAISTYFVEHVIR